MNILMLTAGSRGDIQPFVALGSGLQRAGHTITLCTGRTFERFIRDNGLNFAPMNDEILSLKDTSAGKQALEGKSSLQLMKQAMPMLRRMLDDGWAAAKNGADLIIYHPKTLSGAHVAEKLGIPAIIGALVPIFVPTSAFPNPLMASWKVGALNHATYGLTRMASLPYAGMINKWRETDLGLPRVGRMHNELTRADGQPTPVMHGISAHVMPRPADWGDHVSITGYWFMDEEAGWQPGADLLRFLDAGDPPVYIGFGSMTGTDPAGKAKRIIEAVQQTGQRAILATGWGGLQAADLPESIHLIQSAPHAWLFPRMSAVVHHGGAGTTAAGLRAGVPSIVVQFMGDQHYWAQRVVDLGVGPAPIPQKRLTTEAFAEALQRATTDRAMQQRAAHIGEHIRAEDGIANAVREVEKVAAVAVR